MKRPKVTRAASPKLFDRTCVCGCGRQFRGGSSSKFAPECRAARLKTHQANRRLGTGQRDQGNRWLSADDRAMLAEAAGPDPAERRVVDENGALVACRRLAMRYRQESDPRLQRR